ncbi:MAG: GNAT family N-acetyltransferase [Alphaproteobacteria bacterium]|nr:GNAT family N-acetyltransferase [Alphaproteobacteria bacterium]
MYEPQQRHSLSVDQVFQPNIRFFVAQVDGEPAGCGGVGFYDGYAEVKRMYARPAVRRRGIAKAVLARLEEEARQAGHTLLRLETGIHQSDAVAFYERHGFRQCLAFGPYTGMSEAQIGTSLFYEKRL